MNWKAVGIETGKIYATGTHADCSRVVNDGGCAEVVKIMRADQTYMPYDAVAETERLAKEWQLAELQEKERLSNERAEREQKRKEELEARRLAEIRMREEKQEARRTAERILREHEKIERMALAEQLKAKQKERAERAKEKLAAMPRIVTGKPESRGWTEEEEAFLLENHEMETYDLLELMRTYRPTLTVNALTTRLHIVRKKNGYKSERKYTRWDDEMDGYIVENYGIIEACDMAVVFGVTRTSLYQRIRKLRREGHKLEVAQ